MEYNTVTFSRLYNLISLKYPHFFSISSATSQGHTPILFPEDYSKSPSTSAVVH